MHAEHADSDKLNDLSGLVNGCAFAVLNTLGVGFLEKVYENALAYELRASGLLVVQQCGVRVHYKDVVVGEYFVDLLVEGFLLVELKTVKALDDAHMPRALDPGVGCNASIISKRPVCSSACCLISTIRAWRSNAWSTACEPRCEPHRTICVFCVHPPSFALKPFLPRSTIRRGVGRERL
jgi:GxxExxY protein